jgi:hypothetical protein
MRDRPAFLDKPGYNHYAPHQLIRRQAAGYSEESALNVVDGQRRPRSSIRMQYNSQCATRSRCPSCMRPALLRACTLSFCTRAASSLAPCLAAACERYLEWRRPQTFTCHQPARLITSILILALITRAPSSEGEK